MGHHRKRVLWARKGLPDQSEGAGRPSLRLTLFVIVTLVLLIWAGIWAFSPQSSTLISLTLRVSAVEWQVSEMNADRNAFNFALGSTDSLPFSVSGAKLEDGQSQQQYMSFYWYPGDSKSSVRLERLHFDSACW